MNYTFEAIGLVSRLFSAGSSGEARAGKAWGCRLTAESTELGPI